jgi:hypothetical protein
MDAFGNAFDIVIVGALALPWVLLVTHLFFSETESSLKKLLAWVKEQDQPALVGVLLFAMAYPIGSAVSRIAQDFFDDDDLHVQVFHHLFRVGVTESSIRTDVFCNTFKQDTPAATPGTTDANVDSKADAKVDAKPDAKADSRYDARSCNPPAEKGEPSRASAPRLNDSSPDKPEPSNTAPSKTALAVSEKDQKFRSLDPECTYTGRWIIRTRDRDTHQCITSDFIRDQETRAGDVFYVHEAAVLLKGTDPNERLRQFHDQIIVLRGAGFDGILAFSLCLFWWASKFQSGWRWAALLPYLAPGAVATVNHLTDHLHDPPYMEFTFFVLFAVGARLIWQRTPKKKSAHGEARVHNGKGEVRVPYLFLSLFLTVAALLGWWATQVLYDQQVIFSYKSLSETPAEPATPSKN